VCTPSLLLEGASGTIALDMALMLLGVAATSSAVVGYLGRPLPAWLRGTMMLTGLACMPLAVAGPVWAQVNIAAGLMVILFFVFEFISGRRQKPASINPDQNQQTQGET
ncbi:MAG: hypothetical protein RJQ21_09815, partial [Rhodospirillales bacterium]